MAALCHPAVGSSTDAQNQVNERIPISKAELEAHWKVDCAALWSALQTPPLCTGTDNLPAEILRELQLCAFIHQPPGEPVNRSASDSCPDYGRALGAVNAQPERRCAALKLFLQQQPDCQSSGNGTTKSHK